MTDRELLELAARAAGYDIYVWGTRGQENVARMDLPNRPRWNPLTDDGDEARLESKLGLDVVWFDGWVQVSDCTERHEDHGGDVQKARRYAGVRAAAEIGKGIK